MVSVMAAFSGYSQAEITVTAPSVTGATTQVRAPNGLTSQTTLRGVIIIPASELTAIPSGTTITKLSLILSAAGTGSAGGTIQYYLENTADVTNLKSTDWATLTSTMTSVYTGAFNLPAVAGPTGDLTLTTGFVYSGGSLYVAYDYLGATFATGACTYSANSSLAGSWKGLATATTTPAPTLTGTSAFRPCFRFTFTNPFTNELNVTGMAGEKGSFNNTIKTTQTVTSLISNTSQGTILNIPVTLDVTGANPYTVTQMVDSIQAGATSTVLFNNVPTVTLGSRTLTVSIPSDENNTNNSRTFTQNVHCDTIGYAQNSVQSGSVGFNTGAGLIGVRHIISNTIETYVKSVSNYFPVTASIAGNTMKGILLDGNGVILDSTDLITITAGMLGTKQDFAFLNGAIDVSGGTIYVGFRQNANATIGYFPFANQNNSYVDPTAAATFNLFGGGANPLGSTLGYMMIEAVLTYGGFDVTNSSNAGIVCTNSPLNIIPTAGYANYEFFIDGSSVQNGSTSTYSTAPLTADINFMVNITNGACILNSNMQTIVVPPAILNNFSASICSNQTYTFGSQTLSAAGTYTNTLVSTLGCDSVVVLSLSINQTSSSTLNAAICQGGTYTLGSQVLSTSGTYTEVVPNAVGCDSTITLTLIVNTPTVSTNTLTLCENGYQFGSQTLTASGTYTNTIINVAGCDSVITLNLTLNPPVTATATTSGTTINSTVSPSVNTYQWIDCASGNPIMSETAASYSPMVNGSYAVIVGNPSGCIDTSNCAVVNTIGFNELSLKASLQVYPNPAVNDIHIVSNGNEIISYAVIDITGRVVLTKSIENKATELNVSLETINQGAYMLEVQTAEGKVYKSFVKN